MSGGKGDSTETNTCPPPPIVAVVLCVVAAVDDDDTDDDGGYATDVDNGFDGCCLVML